MSLTIHCPKCDTGLKLPDRSFLGRKGKCPKCSHRFTLEEPDEVELQLAEPEPPPLPPKTSAPMVGTSAKWVPDAPAEADPVFPLANAATDSPPFSSVAPPATAFPVPPVDTSAFPEANAFPSVAGEASLDLAQAAAGQTTNELDFAGPPTTDVDGASVSKLVRSRRKRKGIKGPIVIGVGTALFVASMVGLWLQFDKQKQLEAQAAATAKQPQQNAAWEEEKEDLADSNLEAKGLSPTSGEVIPLDFMPFTPQLICHLRPAEIWGPDPTSQEFIALTADLGTWLSDKILELTRFEPSEVEEITFALNFGARTSAPDLAGVVRLRNEQSVSDLQLNRFQGQVRPDLDEQIFEGKQYSYMLIDNKTFAFAPASMSTELAEAKTDPRHPPIELTVLHRESDRARRMSVLFDIANIDTHREYIFGESLQVFADQFALWFGKDIRTISWSLHNTSDTFFMETLLRPDNASSTLKAERYIKMRLSRLPETVTQMTRFMKPTQLGYRKLIGRLPAMLHATNLGTTTHIGPDYVRMVTLLPERAGPNLAAASLFAWNQSLSTDFSGPAPVIAKGPGLAETVAGRLKMPVIVDFRRMPLQEAFAYVADEIKTPITINGDALKLAGMTQNMPQTYDLGEVPALQAIDAMISNPDYKGMLVIVVDENSKTIELTTRPVAEETGLTIYKTKP